MAVFVGEKRKSFWNLTLAVWAARRDLRKARHQITAYKKEYHWGGMHDGVTACINKFERVVIDSPKINQIDDSGTTLFCHLFDSKNLCENRKCAFYANNLDYAIAMERYKGACDARYQRICEFFGMRSK